MQKVLVVDDEPELVRLLGRTLGAAGFAAVGAPSGERALELMDKDSRVRDLEIQLAMAEQVGTVRADEGTESLVRASRDRDARLIQAAEKLVQMARFLRANEKLVRALEAHVAALRLG